MGPSWAQVRYIVSSLLNYTVFVGTFHFMKDTLMTYLLTHLEHVSFTKSIKIRKINNVDISTVNNKNSCLQRLLRCSDFLEIHRHDVNCASAHACYLKQR